MHLPTMSLFAFLVVLCWPNLRPYNKRKLAFRSARCVFLGYSPRHKGVKCLDVSTGRVYISRDVVFDENVFPFASLNPNAGKRLSQDILLLPTSSSHGDAHANDYMPLPFVPVTNAEQENVEAAEENSDEIDEEMPQNGARNDAVMSSQNDETGSESDATESASDHGDTSGSPPPSPHVASVGGHDNDAS